MSDQITNIDPTDEFRAASREILRQWQSGDLPFESASAQFRELRDKTSHQPNVAHYEFNMGYMQSYRTNLPSSEQHFENARRIYEEIGNERRQISAVLNLGEIARLRGDFPRAIRLFDEVYEALKDEDDRRVPASIAIANKGQVLISLKRYNEAKEALEAALEIYAKASEEEQGSQMDLLNEIHHGLATIYLEADQPEDAWEEAKKTYRIASEDGRPLPVGFANRTMAETLTALGGEIPEADAEEFPMDIDTYFQLAIQAFREIAAEGELARTTFAQAKSLAARGRKIHAARRLQEAIISLSSLGMVDDAAKAAELQTEIF